MTPGEAMTYDDLTMLTRDACVTSTTDGHVGVLRGDLSPLERTGVAAITVSETAGGLHESGKWLSPRLRLL